MLLWSLLLRLLLLWVFLFVFLSFVYIGEHLIVDSLFSHDGAMPRWRKSFLVILVISCPNISD